VHAEPDSSPQRARISETSAAAVEHVCPCLGITNLNALKRTHQIQARSMCARKCPALRMQGGCRKAGKREQRDGREMAGSP